MEPGEMNAPPPQTELVFSEREEEILAVAGELLVKWGYKRVTMEDIARYSGIGKGTIYLHWKSRDALFQTLLFREVLIIWRELLTRVRANPNEIRYSRLMRNLFVYSNQRTLGKALFTGDTEVLGKLAGNGNPTLRTQQWGASQQFVTQFRLCGLLRSDDPIPQQLFMLQGALTGFFMVNPALTDEEGLTLEERGEVLAQTIERLFEPPHLPPATELATIAAGMETWMEYLCAQYERVIQGLMAP